MKTFKGETFPTIDHWARAVCRELADSYVDATGNSASDMFEMTNADLVEQVLDMNLEIEATIENENALYVWMDCLRETLDIKIATP